MYPGMNSQEETHGKEGRPFEQKDADQQEYVGHTGEKIFICATPVRPQITHGPTRYDAIFGLIF